MSTMTLYVIPSVPVYKIFRVYRNSVRNVTYPNTLCLKKNDNDVLRYNFNAHQPILIIFGRDIAE